MGPSQWGFQLDIPDFKSIVEQARKQNFPILELESAQLLYFICLLHKPNQILELGTGLGYSTRHMAAALSKCIFYLCDYRQDLLESVSAELGDFECHLFAGSVIENLKNINQTFDLIFLDIDKRDYLNAFNLSWSKLKPDGLMVVDNVFFSGQVFQDNPKKKQGVQSILQLIDKIKPVPSCLFPVGDGLLVIKKPIIQQTDSLQS